MVTSATTLYITTIAFAGENWAKHKTMENKELSIRQVKQDIGWIYPDLKWLTEKEAIRANEERKGLLQSLSHKVSYSFGENKIHTGKLSPGCLICGEGYWSCMFINGLCTAHCFYCPQDRKMKEERPPTEDGITFDNAQDYVDYLEKFNFKGVGFSGGEPLLIFEKLLEYLRKIRERFGKVIYLWIYTNGDLVNQDKLKRLKEAGLDEIRFDISAKDYDLRPVELAVNIINTVTVEIPAIPEDCEIVKKCLVKLQKIGVKHLHLHQLNATEYNYKNFSDRCYTFLHRPSIPIFESEITALKLISYAIDNKISLPVNYCSSVYKNRLQSKGKRERSAPLISEDFEELTSTGYIRSLSVEDSPKNIKKIVHILQEKKCQDNLWQLNDTKTTVSFHSSLLKYIDFSKNNLTITYFHPQLMPALNSNESGKEVALNAHKKVFLRKELVACQKLASLSAIQSFQKLFIENMKEEEVRNYFYRSYELKNKKSLDELKKEMELLIAFKAWEHLEAGFPEIY